MIVIVGFYWRYALALSGGAVRSEYVVQAVRIQSDRRTPYLPQTRTAARSAMITSKICCCLQRPGQTILHFPMLFSITRLTGEESLAPFPGMILQL